MCQEWKIYRRIHGCPVPPNQCFGHYCYCYYKRENRQRDFTANTISYLLSSPQTPKILVREFIRKKDQKEPFAERRYSNTNGWVVSYGNIAVTYPHNNIK